MRPTGVALALAASLCAALVVRFHPDAGPQPGQEFRYSGTCSEQRITNTLELTGVATLSPSELQYRTRQERALEAIAKIADTEALPSPDETDPAALQAAKAQLARFAAEAPGSPYLPAVHSLDMQLEHALAVINRARKQAMLVGHPAPDVALKDAAGANHSLHEYAGNTLLLNFFATWCGPCNEAAPQIEANIWRKRRHHGVMVVGVDSPEQHDQAALVRVFRARHGLTFPLLMDVDGSAGQAFHVQAIPVNVVVDSGGIVRYIGTGYDEAAVTSALDKLSQR